MKAMKGMKSVYELMKWRWNQKAKDESMRFMLHLMDYG
jgi:hypothetical protein